MNWRIGLVIAIVGIAYAIGIGFGIRESNKCDRHVTFTDSTEMDCRKVNSYNDGTSHIRTCDGSLIIVPTLRVKEITEIKTND
jgi:hypothetical protein